MEWNEKLLKGLVKDLKLRRISSRSCSVDAPMYGANKAEAKSLMVWLMRLRDEWTTLGYTETDLISLVQYLANHQRVTTEAMGYAIMYQHPLSSELAKALVDAGAFDKDALSLAIFYQRPLTLELAKLLIDAGCDPAIPDTRGYDFLPRLAEYRNPVDPRVTDLFLSAGCRTNLDEYECFSDETRSCFEQMLQEHAAWKSSLEQMSSENDPSGSSYGPDWRS